MNPDDDNLPEVRIIRSASLTALIRIMDNVLGRIVYLHRTGSSREAMDRLSFVEGLLLNCLSLVAAMQQKIGDEAGGPLTEADAEAFAEQLASMPEVAEPNEHG